MHMYSTSVMYRWKMVMCIQHCHMYITSRGHSEALKIEQDVKTAHVDPS